jgi:glycosyltransferase involved in cell wall biosynthesis
MSRRRSIEAAVDSLLAQTHPAVEALIVNDGSFEEADEVLGRLAARPRVRVVTQLNGGEAAARNLGTFVAEGEYLVMLDADNELEPEFVERALAVLLASPRLRFLLASVHRSRRLPDVGSGGVRSARKSGLSG